MHPTVVFASGKGGVGKSTVALNVAVALARSGMRIGLVDADIYGPDIPAMLGITRRANATSIDLWGVNQPKLQPIDAHGVRVMSPQFLIGENQSMDWQIPLVELLLRRFLHQTDWGELDLMLVDLPPGTGDLQQAVFNLLENAKAVLIVTPQYVSHLDARKLLSMLRRRNIEVVGGIENMAGLACPHCGNAVDLFAPTPDDRTLWSSDVVRLARLPFLPYDESVDGMPFVLARPETTVAESLTAAAQQIRNAAVPDESDEEIDQAENGGEPA